MWTARRNSSWLWEAVERLERHGTEADVSTYANLLQACTELRALQQGRTVHAHILKFGLASDRVLGNHIVSMYGRCGNVHEAARAFEKIREKNVVSWSAMISAYAQQGRHWDAVFLFRRMQLDGFKADKITFLSILKACSTLAEAKCLHSCLQDCGFATNPVCGTALLSMYSRCGSLANAEAVFDMDWDDVVAWNAMISAYARSGHSEAAVRLYRCMLLQGLRPTKITFVAVLAVCASVPSLELGRLVHGHATEFQSDLVVATALVDLYAKCGEVVLARSIFDGIMQQQRDVVCWNAMLAAYALNGPLEAALELFFKAMQEEAKPNRVTLVTLLDVCAGLASLNEGKRVHEMVRTAGLRDDAGIATALLNMYAKCGDLRSASEVFASMRDVPTVAWSIMILAYKNSRQEFESLQLWKRMQLEGVKANCVTVVTVLDACAASMNKLTRSETEATSRMFLDLEKILRMEIGN